MAEQPLPPEARGERLQQRVRELEAEQAALWEIVQAVAQYEWVRQVLGLGDVGT